MPRFTYQERQLDLFCHELDKLRHYRYDDARQYCKGRGMAFREELIDEPDEMFKAAGLTQTQVDMVMREHINAMKRLFNPKTYSWKDRLALAARFLFGIA